MRMRRGGLRWVRDFRGYLLEGSVGGLIPGRIYKGLSLGRDVKEFTDGRAQFNCTISHENMLEER